MVLDWVIHHLAWWASPAGSQGLSLEIQDTDFPLFTDASTHGWGLNWVTTVSVASGPKLNVRATSMISKWKPFIVPSVDNVTVVSYIKQEGGTKSFGLTRLIIRLLKFCDHKAIVIVGSIGRDAATFRRTACHHQDRHYPTNERSKQTETCYGRCSTAGCSHGSICLPHSQQQEMSSVHIPVSGLVGGLHRCTVDPVEPDGHSVCLSTVHDHPNSHSQAQTVPSQSE